MNENPYTASKTSAPKATGESGGRAYLVFILSYFGYTLLAYSLESLVLANIEGVYSYFEVKIGGKTSYLIAKLANNAFLLGVFPQLIGYLFVSELLFRMSETLNPNFKQNSERQETLIRFHRIAVFSILLVPIFIWGIPFVSSCFE